MNERTYDKITVFLSELLGTGFLVLIGCMGCLKWTSDNNYAGSSFNFGLAGGVLIQIFGCISGAHINPAVSIGALVYQIINLQTFFIYVVAQLIGSFMGYGMLKAIIPTIVWQSNSGDVSGNGTIVGFCTTVPQENVSWYQAMIVEFLAVYILVSVCCSLWDKRNANNTDSASIKLGICLSILGYTISPISGGSINPARSFGPAIWNGIYEHQWIYWIGPMAGGLFASLFYKRILITNYKNVNES